MAEWLELHPVDPQRRWLMRAVERVRAGAVIAYPTDSCYALGCQLGDKDAAERIRTIRRFDRNHLFTLVCRDLAEISTYARVDNRQYRLLKTLTPGPYTFVLEATRELPRRLAHEKRKTIGIRVPDHRVTQALLELLDEPLMSCTLQLPDEEHPVSDPKHCRRELDHLVDLVLDGGVCGLVPTTVIDLTGDVPVLVRQGRGDVSGLGLEPV
ncbi:MAG: L-threonylcarbamoyladenylate synthase [Nevskia sp.]|nr:L-threonylcarbamoyladenylate synthase [Nevskia sp.]